nr:patatin-like phospholipase domain-containing protein 2 isoform X1 [Ipomoea batatas]GME08984.1 patatin-like phospholipase domain-containing protein 2 isoform X1 [Ipomoea batatas]GME19549.1 patatin-like phospholipase domain-containing protein 2 isoform X1 [Ipomoea batatas]
MASLSSLALSNPRPLRPLPNPNRNLRLAFPLRTTTTLKFSAKANSKPPPPPPPSTAEEKKSFAVATGELFIGLASRILKRRGVGSTEIINAEEGEERVTMFKDDSERESYLWKKRKEGIATVVEDPVQPEVLWEQSVKDVEAERRRKAVTSPGFSFSAAGLLFPYHLGVSQFLIEKGYIKDTTPLAGSSAGAIVCATIASGSSMQEALQATKELAKDCRLKGTAFRLGAVLRNILIETLPDDIHIRSNGRVRSKSKLFSLLDFSYKFDLSFLPSVDSIAFIVVAVTEILWRPRGLLVDQFDSKEDLINAVITSSFIPGYLAPRPVTMFRNRVCIDGGLTLFMPPTSAPETVRVCAFPASRLGLRGIGISPDCNPENRATARQLFNWALEPAEDDILDMLFELGYADAAVWSEQNPVENLVQDHSSGLENSVEQ